ncbi:sensor histidine kinase [Cryobacterium mannosilyticum]|uniref:histidine kinase n=1 Tax=Cryobacterium mannosilyticum TaxID=1259190 RepID=A0A4R8W5J3_9MICO|nr:histidine kinase [Cryobacterium mannosilyticum]TFC03091.1 two-component sensor histidine kinase [Cryobacterium mannosilyticum]
MTNAQLTPGRPSRPPGGDLRLPTPPGVARRFWARHPWLTDSLVAAGYFVPMTITVLIDLAAPGGPARPSAVVVTAVVTALLTAALLFRRHAPLLVLGVTCAGLLASFPSQGQGDTVPVLIALYAVAVYRGVRSAWLGLIAGVGVAALGAYLADGATYAAWPSVAGQYAILMLAATLLGVTIGDRKRYVAALVDLAAQLARERDQQAQLARVTERGRIAREMHDIVAHSLSVMVALADGADALLDKDPERSRTALREVAATGRSSMTEMRRLLGVLAEDPPGPAGLADPADRADPADHDGRDGPDQADPASADAPLNPQPGADQLVDLVDSFRPAGLPARLELSGRIPANPGLQLTIYRIVQESLTNALRYAAAATLVSVRVASTPGRVEVVVADNGRRRVEGPAQPPGRGLIGLRERAALYGGTLEAGAIPGGGGWQVRAVMDVDEPEAAE